mgnify:FL=1
MLRNRAQSFDSPQALNTGTLNSGLENQDKTPKLYDISSIKAFKFDQQTQFLISSPLSNSIRLSTLKSTAKKPIPSIPLQESKNPFFNCPGVETERVSTAAMLQNERQEKQKLKEKVKKLEEEARQLRRLKVLMKEKDRVADYLERNLEKYRNENLELRNELAKAHISYKQMLEARTTTYDSSDPVERINSALSQFQGQFKKFLHKGTRSQSHHT